MNTLILMISSFHAHLLFHKKSRSLDCSGERFCVLFGFVIVGRDAHIPPFTVKLNQWRLEGKPPYVDNAICVVCKTVAAV